MGTNNTGSIITIIIIIVINSLITTSLFYDGFTLNYYTIQLIDLVAFDSLTYNTYIISHSRKRSKRLWMGPQPQPVLTSCSSIQNMAMCPRSAGCSSSRYIWHLLVHVPDVCPFAYICIFAWLLRTGDFRYKRPHQERLDDV